jgi:hypothetical protein
MSRTWFRDPDIRPFNHQISATWRWSAVQDSFGYWLAQRKSSWTERLILMRKEVQTDYSRWRGPSFCWVVEPFWHDPSPPLVFDHVAGEQLTTRVRKREHHFVHFRPRLSTQPDSDPVRRLVLPNMAGANAPPSATAN